MTIPIRWSNLEPDIAADLAKELREDGASAVDVIDSSRDLPQELIDPISIMLVVLLGTVAIGKLAQVVTAFTCRHKKPGLIIDVRGKELNIQPRPELPGGTVLIFAKDGSSKTIEVCKGDIDLDKTIKALLEGATAAGAV